MYASDASNYRMVPLGVVLPKDSDDVVAAVAGCRRFGAPIFARGGGTSIPGQTVNNGVVFDFSKYMNRIIELNPDQQTARVQPGMVLDTLRNASNKFGLTFGPDPATHSRCTLGGMIANNSCGIHSVTAGETSDNIEELEILTYDGTRMRVGPTNEHDLAQITRAGGQGFGSEIIGHDRGERIERRIRAEIEGVAARAAISGPVELAHVSLNGGMTPPPR